MVEYFLKISNFPSHHLAVCGKELFMDPRSRGRAVARCSVVVEHVVHFVENVEV